MLKVELGGGVNPRKRGWLNVDKIRHSKVDYQCDFEYERLPFEDNEVEEYYSYHVLEHIDNVAFFLNECHRTLKPKGTITFVVPYGLWEGACKPGHKQIITERWFDFLRKSDVEKIYGYKKWEILELKELKALENKGVKYEVICYKKWEILELKALENKGVKYEVICKMKPDGLD